MQKNNLSKMGRIVNLFREVAQRPFMPFFMLIMIAAAIAVCIFFYFQNPDLSGASQDQPAPAPDSFGIAKAQKYLKIFSIVEQNKNNYDQTATSTDPNELKSVPGLAR
jgi:hypothetical protein